MLSASLLSEISGGLAIPRIDSVTHIPNIDSVADATQKFVLSVGLGRRFILIVSSKVSPLLVQRGVDKQRQVKSLLRGQTAEAVELPLLEGFDDERSYAVWAMRQPLSSNRIIFKIQMALLAPRVFRWLRDVSSQSFKIADPAEMAIDAGRLLTLAALPASIRGAAETARDAFLSGTTPSIRAMQHGDLWIGNVLKAPSKTGFIIVDWPGAKIDGVPFFDLVKFVCSIGASSSTLRREVTTHSKILGCNPKDALTYVLCGLGRLYAELEYFPENRFIELCKQKVRALSVISEKAQLMRTNP